MAVSGSLRSTGVVVMVTWFRRDFRQSPVSGLAFVESCADERTGAATQSAAITVRRANDMARHSGFDGRAEAKCTPPDAAHLEQPTSGARESRTLRLYVRSVLRRDLEPGRRVRERERDLSARHGGDRRGRKLDARGFHHMRRERCAQHRRTQADRRGAAAAAGAGALMASVVRIRRAMGRVRSGCRRVSLRGRHLHARARHLHVRRMPRQRSTVLRTRIPLHRTGNRDRERGAAYQCREGSPEASLQREPQPR